MAISFMWTIFFLAVLLAAPCRCSKPEAIPTCSNTLSSTMDSRDSDVNCFFLVFSLHLSAQGEGGRKGVRGRDGGREECTVLCHRLGRRAFESHGASLCSNYLVIPECGCQFSLTMHCLGLTAGAYSSLFTIHSTLAIVHCICFCLTLPHPTHHTQ